MWRGSGLGCIGIGIVIWMRSIVELQFFFSLVRLYFICSIFGLNKFLFFLLLKYPFK